ncbi:DUF3168 domain-containing protein [Rhizobiaceae bacterium n13]|uniref:DUF3168 domain-containing protein n=1 Tax=Ferirhizobium litorale TaxID=2927786 RepID=UPI0024B2A67B|nr:DUF3168 domain-containing protein [Fererhizobium litorale]MDI7864091.1 DUF3168 domain-containing protein [Fererhizobium litorale]
MTPETALQKAVRDRLVESDIVSVLVPGASILDRNERPAPSPSIIIGEGQSVDEGDSLDRNRVTVFLDLHVWKKEPSTAGVKAIAGAVRTAIHSGRLVLAEGFHCIDASVQSMRFLRDPDGETSHAVVTINAKVQEVA